MNITELEICSFQEKLEKEKSSIYNMVKRSAEAIIESCRVAQSVLDRGEKAQVSHELGLNTKLSQGAIAKLRQVNSALRRIEKGTFGSCVDCHDQIHQKRLESVPWESQCLVCKQEQEEEDALTCRVPMPRNYRFASYIGDDEYRR